MTVPLNAIVGLARKARLQLGLAVGIAELETLELQLFFLLLADAPRVALAVVVELFLKLIDAPLVAVDAACSESNGQSTASAPQSVPHSQCHQSVPSASANSQCQRSVPPGSTRSQCQQTEPTVSANSQ